MLQLNFKATGQFFIVVSFLLLSPVASFSQNSDEEAVAFLESSFAELVEGSAPGGYLEMLNYRATTLLVNKAINEGKPSDYYLKIWNEKRDKASLSSSVREYRSLIAAAPQVGPVLETPSMEGIEIQQPGAIINLNSLQVSCPLFDIWSDGRGICNRFSSHLETERHYDAALATVREANQGRDACLNELAQYKNDEGQEPIVPPTSGVKGCEQILQVEGNKDFIYKQSAPIRASAAGSPITGFRQEPTLIMNVDISSKGRIPILNSNGDQIVSCPWATADGHRGGRARCTAKTSDVRRRAIANTGSPSILFKVNATQCVLVPDAGRCVNSTKGQCDRLIQ